MNKSAILNWVQFTAGNDGYAVEFIFDGDIHLEIAIDKGMTATQVAEELIAAGMDLLTNEVRL